MLTTTESNGATIAPATQVDPCDDPSPNGANLAPAQPQPSMDDRLEEICHLVKRGVQPPRRTVRCLLGWMGVSRRSFNVNQNLEAYLTAYELATVPDFAFANVDDEITFVPAASTGGDGSQEASYRVGQLKAANSKLVCVTLDSTLAQAVTLMMHSNYSQLPVMANDRDVKGVVSWRGIGKRLALKLGCASVRECMEPAQIVSTEDSFFEALEIIAKYDYVLVRGKDKKITGILTASDFNDQFRKMAEPFLLVGEIEKTIRGILTGHFTTEELAAAMAPFAGNRKITGIPDMTFGEYVRLLGTESAWQKIGLHIDKQRFICWLDQVREIRNDVMHFNTDGLGEVDLVRLQEFAQFLRCLREAGAL